MCPKSIPGIHKNPYFSRPFPKVDFWMHFGRPLAHPWLPLSSLWLPFGALWLPLGSLLAPFSFQWPCFWYHLAHFCSPRGSIFSLLTSPGVILAHFRAISSRILPIRFFELAVSTNQIAGHPNYIIPKSVARTLTKRELCFVPNVLVIGGRPKAAQ